MWQQSEKSESNHESNKNAQVGKPSLAKKKIVPLHSQQIILLLLVTGGDLKERERERETIDAMSPNRATCPSLTTAAVSTK